MSLKTRNLSDIEPKPIRWLWKPVVPLRKVTVIAGDPGLGKSTIAIDMAARISNEKRWPLNGQKAKKGRVLICSAEDDPEDTIWARCKAAGADMRKVTVVDGVEITKTVFRGKGDKKGKKKVTVAPFVLDDEAGIQALGEKIKKLGDVRLVVIDPLSAFLKKASPNNICDARGVMSILSALAVDCDVAIVLIHHLNKGQVQFGSAMYRISGSIGFVAAARSAWLVTPDPKDRSKERRLLLCVKLNVAKEPDGFAFRTEGTTVMSKTSTLDTSRIEWLERVQECAEILVDWSHPQGKPGPSPKKLSEAMDFLRDFLGDGPQKVKVIEEAAEANGHVWSTVQDARAKLNIVAERKVGEDGRLRAWIWRLAE